MKKVVSIVLCSLLLLSLVGCGDVNDIKTLTKLQSEDSEASGSIVSLSATDKENLIYSQVSDRTLLDLALLESPSAEEIEATKLYLDTVDSQLCGTLDETNGVIDSCFTNYLLCEFEKTPNYWQRTKLTILGVDPSSRSIVADVVYTTIPFGKNVKADSTIVKGEPDYSTKSEVRFNRYISILKSKYGSSFSGADWATSLAEFESVYGSVDSILEEQRGDSLTQTVYTYGNQLSYSGLVNNPIEQSSAEMTVRYVLTPSYSMGINLGINCTHMYITSYSLSNSEVNNEEFLSSVANDETGITDEVRKVLSSYYSSIDNENFLGLYKLVSNFGSVDKYFEDYFDTTYHKYDDFSVTIHKIEGTTIFCTADVSRKVRARGSEMSLPIYTETYYYVLNIDNGKLKIAEDILLSSNLVGEPQIATDSADVSGFSTSITLSSSDKIDLESLISKFGVVQLNADTTSSAFSDIVDTSIAKSQLNTLKDNILKLSGEQKVTWIVSYLQGTDSYASISCKELVQKEDSSLYDCSVTYDFIRKGGDWFIYGYTVNSKNKLDSTNLSTKNCLCITTKEGVSELDSKVTVETSGEDTREEILGISFDYSQYTPTVKDVNLQYSSTPEQGVDSGAEGVYEDIPEDSEFNNASNEDLVEKAYSVYKLNKTKALGELESNAELVSTLQVVLNECSYFEAGTRSASDVLDAISNKSFNSQELAKWLKGVCKTYEDLSSGN